MAVGLVQSWICLPMMGSGGLNRVNVRKCNESPHFWLLMKECNLDPLRGMEMEIGRPMAPYPSGKLTTKICSGYGEVRFICSKYEIIGLKTMFSEVKGINSVGKVGKIKVTKW